VSANLFLLLTITLTTAGQQNDLIIQKKRISEDTLEKISEYIRIKPSLSKVKIDSIQGPVRLQLNADSVKTASEKPAETSPLIPVTLSYLVEQKKDTVKIQSYFAPHSLPVKNLNEQNRRKNIHNWAFIILIIGFSLLAGIQIAYHKRMQQVLKAFVASRFLNQLTRGGDFYKERITYNLYLIFLIVFPLYLYELNQYYQLFPLPRRPYTEVLLYLELFVLNLLVYFLKVFLLRSAGNIFKTREITGEYLMTHFIFSLTEGLIILLFLGFIIFSQSFLALQISIIVLLLVYAFQLGRGFVIGLKNTGYSILYLFVFFFTIEILPVLFLVKVFSLSINN